ncbi:MAG: SagB/ThcOx family dehydrogenase [Deltaproteobacteria bacterium]|nr:SagB/ThcOx family dehydrogenase [Deltaproteobacteria bacterium]
MGLLEDTCAYHERSKHRPDAYAAGPGFLDWANQPDPWRTYAGSPEHRLPLRSAAPYHSSGGVPNADDVGALLERSLAISAWKEFRGTRWALRCNPSSGNLHPTEAWLLLPALEGIGSAAGLYHYRSRDHVLELRCEIGDDELDRLMGALPDGMVIGLSSVMWREAWKYGERAFRYCHLDVGHAIAAISYAAATIGLRVSLLPAPTDSELAALLGLDRDDDYVGVESESADVLLLVSNESASGNVSWPSPEAIARARCGTWHGKPNQLSSIAIDWKAISRVELATRKTVRGFGLPMLERRASSSPAWVPSPESLLGRRSAQDFDSGKGMTQAQLWSILERVMPGDGCPPWDAVAWQPMVHLAVFIHAVDGMEPGLYVLPRSDSGRPMLERAMREEWDWERVQEAPAHVPLLRLGPMSARSTAGFISCQQAIAADGALAFAMLAEFDQPMQTHGPWVYRRLFWECGAIGQALYIGAESAGLRATGIGCYFDDLMHGLLGLEGSELQSLYHLAIGTAVDDARIATIPPYTR